ncbi:MAG: YitT family protein, partial [Clostridiales Family XIII bacterium]|nr:YitT family protein [Clostridiales Family XIII bacterium]
MEKLGKLKRLFATIKAKFVKHKKIWTPVSHIMFLLFANICYVLAVQLFFAGNNIAAGGFAGIATVINYIVPISIGNIVLIMNIPLIIISFFVFDWKYTLKILLSILVYAGLFQLVETFPLATTDRFAACVFGGVLYAVGAVFVLYARTSAGGTDLVARLLLRKFKHLSLGKMFLCVDGCVVIFAIIVYRNIESGVYAIAAIFVCSFLTDHIISG